VLFLGGMVGFWFLTTQYLQGVLGLRPLEAGMAFLATTLPNLAAAMMVPRLTRRLGNGGLLAGGLTLSISGLAWLGQASACTPYLTGVALPMVLIGMGQGCVLAPLTVSAVSGVAAEDAGAASGLVNTAHQLGASLGISVLAVVLASATPLQATGPQVLADRIATAINAAALMHLIAFVIALVGNIRLPLRHAASLRRGWWQ
jgi:hypothetical protein